MSQDFQTAERENESPSAAKWQPIGRIERRVLGVLVEKAKTTPDAYPMTLNSLTNGCNQKSNRDPQMNLEPDDVEEVLEKLRHLGAAVEVVGDGRVNKYRHMMYEWMGVNKVEAAVMAELLLRGAQTIGELRGRASRMEPIADVASLRPIIQSLIDKGLMVSLTAEGRGQIVSHALYLPDELEKLKRTVTASHRPASEGQTSAPPPTDVASPSPQQARTGGEHQSFESLRREVDQLRSELDRLKTEVNDLWSNIR